MFDDLASSADPYPAYAELRGRGVHRVDDGRWVVARATDVATVLADPAAHVECRRSGHDRLDDVRSLMARFSNGADHLRRRAIANDALSAIVDGGDLQARAEAIAMRALRDGIDLVALARHTVPFVLADALGFTDPLAVASATGVLASALAPRLDAPALSNVAVDAAIDALLVAAPAALGAGEEVAVNLVALLHQSLDATAGLVASTVLAAATHDCERNDADALIREANRWDPPVQHTTRIAATEIRLGGTVIAAGERIVVLLAAANRDPVAVNAPDEFRPARVERGLGFGSGAHACPGESIAFASASGIVAAVRRAGLRPAGDAVRYERRSNLRIPAALTVVPV